MSSPVSPVVCRLMLDAMALVVAADDEGEEHETPMVAEVYEKLTQQILAPVDWSATLTTARAEADRVWAAFDSHKTLLIPDEKDLILTAAVLVCIADAELQDTELQLLSRMARHLGVPIPQLRQAMNKAWQEARGLT